MTTEPVLLLDVPGESGRTAVSALASLTARLATLPVVSGSDAVGAIAAGYASLGRAVAQTADGARMRQAIERSRAGENGDLLWRKWRIDEWLGGLPPADVLRQLQNDAALLAAPDLAEILELPPAPAEMTGAADAARPGPVAFADFLTGLWAFGRLAADVIEELSRSELESLNRVVRDGAAEPGDRDGPLLR